ncbi:MAG TPA: DUF84 family protein, partial [Candidatus Acidoferrum sp.]|nr:DUF84 family protein [Candidatus Acidoferrum sp.]
MALSLAEIIDTQPRVVVSDSDVKAEGVEVFYDRGGWRAAPKLIRYPASSEEPEQPTDVVQGLGGVKTRSDKAHQEHPDAIIYAFENIEAELVPGSGLYYDLPATAITLPDGTQSISWGMSSRIYRWMRHWVRAHQSQYGFLVQGLVPGLELKDPMAYRSKDLFPEYTRAAILTDSLPAAAAPLFNPLLFGKVPPPNPKYQRGKTPKEARSQAMSIPAGFKGDVIAIGSPSLLKWRSHNGPLQQMHARKFLPNPVTLVSVDVQLDKRFDQPPDFVTIQNGALIRAEQAFEAQPYALYAIGTQSGWVILGERYYEVTCMVIKDALDRLSIEWSVMVPLPPWMIREANDYGTTISEIAMRYGGVDSVAFLAPGLDRHATMERLFIGAMLPHL